MNGLILRVGEKLSRHAYFLYKPLYSVYKGITDRQARKLIRKSVRKDMTVVDVGANIGIYTRFLCQVVGPSGKVIAVEPSPTNCKRLRNTVAGFANVQVVQGAATDYNGKIPLYLSSMVNVDHRTYETGEPRERIVVPAYRLDDVLGDFEQIHLIKMDIQGFELHALRGLEGTLEKNPAIGLIIELWPYGLRRAGTDPKDLISFLRDRGFELRVVEKNMTQDLRHEVESDCETDYWNIFAQRTSMQ